jgi:oligopeptide transport system substrate-binding protein
LPLPLPEFTQSTNIIEKGKIMHFRIILFLTFFSLLGCSGKQETSPTHQYLSIAAADDPTSLDPRLVRDLSSSSVMRMLYEGLLRKDFGNIVAGIAEHYTVSKDQKTYTFHLRPSVWSDGSPLTAEDFEQTWKSVLSPAFPAPNAYQLYIIKGAKDAKEGLASPDDIGVKATNSSTLVVELEHPAPYFIEMVACHFFFPVHESVRNGSETQEYPGNGPFELSEWKKRNEMTFVKNPQYWDAAHVNLEGISLQVLDEHTAFQLFKAGRLDWAGSPLSTLPQDAIEPLKKQNLLKIAEGAGTYWFRLNTAAKPFDNEKMRRAFALALNRQTIVDHVTKGNQQPALNVVPPSFGLVEHNTLSDNNPSEAKALFEEALAETGQFPQMYLTYVSNDRNHKIAQAVQQQWNKALGINLMLDANESHMQLDKVKKGNYQISLGSWFADIQDPINFLEIFKSSDNPTNQTGWQRPDYTLLIHHSSLEFDPEKRKQLLAQAEKILLDDIPVIPLFFAAYNYVSNDHVDGVYFSPLGYLDFKHATVTMPYFFTTEHTEETQRTQRVK